MADRNVRIVRHNGVQPTIKYFPKVASTAFDRNSLVEFGSGTLNPADDNDVLVLGIIKEEIAATDADYASTTEKGVQLVGNGVEVEIDATGGTAAVGTSYGISNAYTVDVADTTNKVFTVTKVISATRVIGFFPLTATNAVQ